MYCKYIENRNDWSSKWAREVVIGECLRKKARVNRTQELLQKVRENEEREAERRSSRNNYSKAPKH